MDRGCQSLLRDVGLQVPKRISLHKVTGTANPADMFIRHALTHDKLIHLVDLFGYIFVAGSAASAPELRRDKCGRLHWLIWTMPALVKLPLTGDQCRRCFQPK